MAERVTTREGQFLLGGLLLGLNIGFFVGLKRGEARVATKYDKLAEELREKHVEDLAKTRGAYERARQNWEKPELKEVVENLGYTPEEKAAIAEVVAEEEAEQSVNVFETTIIEGWDYEAEMESRSSLDEGAPYIIHKDEFFQKDDEFEDYEDTTITYYAGDDVLCDERDEVLEPRDHIVGSENLKMFGTGHGSGDPNVLYIRNPRTSCDFEVVMNDGKYSVDVAGFLEHSFERNRRRQRFDDE
jgi:hypothetical protein